MQVVVVVKVMMLAVLVAQVAVVTEKKVMAGLRIPQVRQIKAAEVVVAVILQALAQMVVQDLLLLDTQTLFH
jgi:hypothetical protein